MAKKNKKSNKPSKEKVLTAISLFDTPEKSTEMYLAQVNDYLDLHDKDYDFFDLQREYDLIPEW